MAVFIKGKEAAEKIKNGDSVCVIGNISMLEPETILYEIEQQFLEKGTPRDLTLFVPRVYRFHGEQRDRLFCP